MSETRETRTIIRSALEENIKAQFSSETQKHLDAAHEALRLFDALVYEFDQLIEAALSQQEAVGYTNKRSLEFCLGDSPTFGMMWKEESLLADIPLYTNPQSQKVDVTRDDILQCLVATSGMPDSVAADAIWSMIKMPEESDSYATLTAGSKVPQSVEELTLGEVASLAAQVFPIPDPWDEARDRPWMNQLCEFAVLVLQSRGDTSLMAGKALVPVEPTDKMIDAGVAMALQVSVHGQGGWSNYVRDLYKQMLSASQEGV